MTTSRTGVLTVEGVTERTGVSVGGWRGGGGTGVVSPAAPPLTRHSHTTSGSDDTPEEGREGGREEDIHTINPAGSRCIEKIVVILK